VNVFGLRLRRFPETGPSCPILLLHSDMHATLTAAAARLSDPDLLRRVTELAGRERRAAVDLIAHLAELDRRKLYREQGYGSLFSYCTEALRLSEHATFNRIEAARASRAFPVILDLLADGAVNLSTVRLLAPHLTSANHERLLAEARGLSKREVEVMVARLTPKPDVAASVRKLPTAAVHADAPAVVPLAPASSGAVPSAGSPIPVEPASASGPGVVAATTSAPSSGTLAPSPPSAPRPVVAPLTPERYRIQFTVSRETQEKLRRVQDLLRREIPDGDPAAIFDRALTLLLEHVARQKVAETTNPRPSRGTAPGSRHIPAEVKRKVWMRDHGQCAFVSAAGRRCRQTTFLEFHHLDPYALGGPPTVDNVSLRCREHNVYEAELVFGPWDPAAVREPRAVYSTGRGVLAESHNELCPSRPGASWGYSQVDHLRFKQRRRTNCQETASHGEA
jgi:hypothetical protein